MRQFRFDARLGRVGSNLLSGEETDVIKRLRQAGHRGLWVGPARVQHFIPASRMTRRYVWEFYRSIGQLQCRLEGRLPCATIRGAPRWALRKYATASVLAKLLSLSGGSRWLDAFLNAAFYRGVIDEYRTEPRQGHDRGLAVAERQ
jgi:hypothetical protein